MDAKRSLRPSKRDDNELLDNDQMNKSRQIVPESHVRLLDK